MSGLAPWILLHSGHTGGISNALIAYGLAGIGLVLVVLGLYRLYTYEDPGQGFEDVEDEPHA